MIAEERRKKLKGKRGKQEPYINRTLHATQTVAARAADKGARRDTLSASGQPPLLIKHNERRVIQHVNNYLLKESR